MRMDVFEIRRENLRALIGPERRGAIIDFANRHSLNEKYLSQLINGSRSIGEKSARNLEKQIGLAPGSLDSPGGAGESQKNEAEIVAAINRADFLSLSDKKNLIGIVKTLARSKK